MESSEKELSGNTQWKKPVNGSVKDRKPKKEKGYPLTIHKLWIKLCKVKFRADERKIKNYPQKNVEKLCRWGKIKLMEIQNIEKKFLYIGDIKSNKKRLENQVERSLKYLD